MFSHLWIEYGNLKAIDVNIRIKFIFGKMQKKSAFTIHTMLSLSLEAKIRTM